jgi:hypothetical protein
MLQSEKDGTGPCPGLLVPYRHENNFFSIGYCLDDTLAAENGQTTVVYGEW